MRDAERVERLERRETAEHSASKGGVERVAHLERLREAVRAGRPLRVAMVGDSITWGDGMLDDGFVGAVDELLRTRYAETVHAREMHAQGEARLRRSRKLYGGEALELTGEGSAVRFELEGDALSVVLAAERGGASATVGLYVNGALHDTFVHGPAVWPEAAGGAEALSFVGDGATTRFELRRPFTYGHRVTVDGRETAGGLNTCGYGANFPDAHDWMVLRHYAAAEDHEAGRPEVRHALWFRAAPPAGAAIRVSFRYGETIAYARTTVGETERPLEAPLESRFGDGGVAYDPARPVPVSSGLDFRATDPRAVRTWRFAGRAKRTFELRLLGPAPAAVSPAAAPNAAVPADPTAPAAILPTEAGLIVNFATNCSHELMNAGIGGWTARQFNTDPGLRSADRIAAWQPDLAVIGLGTNDDWEPGNGFAASRRLEGVTREELLRLPALWLQECRPTGPDAFAVETAELLAAAVTARSVTVDARHCRFDGVKPGDFVILGDYCGDNRNMHARRIEHWDERTYTATFAEPLRLDPTALTREPGDYTGQAVRFKRMDGFASQISRLIDAIREARPDAVIAVADTGLCNYYTRLLLGYPELLEQLAKEKGLARISLYEPLLNWQYSQPRDREVYIGPDAAVRSSGADRYPLLDAAGQDIGEAVGTMPRHWSVVVDGVERYGDGCRIEGGYALAFRPELDAEELEISDWDGRSRNPKLAYRFIPARLVFTRDTPPAGSRIVVKVASAKWSWDDTHLGMPGGGLVYAREVKAALEQLLGTK